MSDSLFIEIGLEQINTIPQLFIKKSEGTVICRLEKIVDDLIITGSPSVVDNFVKLIVEKFKLGTIVHGPGELRFFGLNIIQSDDYTIETNGDGKLNALEAY